MPKIEVNARVLIQEAGATAMDLIRYGMAQGTAYSISRDRVKRIDLDTLALLCGFLSGRLQRKITPGDILTLIEDN